MRVEEKFTRQDLEDAVTDLSTIPFFPERAAASICSEMAKMVPHKRALRWVADTAKARCRQWPGLAELRGLLCTRFDAADGIDEPNCSIPGFTPEEQEQRYLTAHEAAKTNGHISGESQNIIRQLVRSMK